MAPSVMPWTVELHIQTPLRTLIWFPLLVQCCLAKGMVFQGGWGAAVIPKLAPCLSGLKEAQVPIKPCAIKRKGDLWQYPLSMPQVLLSQDACMSHCLEIQVARCPPDTAEQLKLLTSAERVFLPAEVACR